MPTLNQLGNSRLLFRVVVCTLAQFTVPLPRFPNRSLCFGLERRNDRTLASDRGPYANRIPRTSNRSGCFDLKRRSNRTQASIRGSYGNRGCAAREICDDEEACEVHSDEASGGPRRRGPHGLRDCGMRKSRNPLHAFGRSSFSPRSVGFVAMMDGRCGPRWNPSPTAKGASPLHPGAVGAEAKGALARR